MSRVYVTDEQDMLDDIAFKTYGDERQIIALLDANPGLVDQPWLLPRGLEITLPEIKQTTPVNTIVDLWG